MDPAGLRPPVGQAGHELATRFERHLRAALATPGREEPPASEAELRRRRRVTGAFTILGAATLGWSLNVEPGSTWFYVASLLLAVVWTAGALSSGPLHLGRVGRRPDAPRPVVAPILIGIAIAAVFIIGALVVREVAVLDDAVDGVLAYARQGSGPLVLLVAVVNGIAEELFFRGALYAAVPARAGRAGDHRRVHDRLDGVGQPDARVRRPRARHPRRDGTPRVRRRARPHPHPRHLVDLNAVGAAGPLRLSNQCRQGCQPHQLDVPGPALNGPVTLSVIQPP